MAFSLTKLKQVMADAGYKIEEAEHEAEAWTAKHSKLFSDFMYFVHGYGRDRAQNALGYPEAMLPKALLDQCMGDDPAQEEQGEHKGQGEQAAHEVTQEPETTQASEAAQPDPQPEEGKEEATTESQPESNEQEQVTDTEGEHPEEGSTQEETQEHSAE